MSRRSRSRISCCLRAGEIEDTSYAGRVNTFDWDTLYASAPYVFKSLAQHLAERYRYVLIDSRTGVTDTSGICTALMPEKLVVVFTPNQQSITGAIELAAEALQYRQRADDLRPLNVYPLPSRVELSEAELRHRWRHGDPSVGFAGYQNSFEELFRENYGLAECNLETYFDEVQIQHSPHYAYGEGIASLDTESISDRLSLSRSYATFTRVLDEAAPWELRRAREELAPSDSREAIVLRRLEGGAKYYGWLGRQSRRRSTVFRLIQVAAVIGAALAGIVVAATPLGGFQAGTFFAVLSIGVAIAGGVELMTRTIWVEDWQEMLSIANRLERERFRFESQTGDYGKTDAPAVLLAERIDEILETEVRPVPHRPAPRPFPRASSSD